MFREGQWLELRSFLLKQRENVDSRVTYINRELKKIGDVSVLYEREDPNDNTSKITEKRKGIIVEKNSSLGKLMKAYVARGGNPFDISMFLKPDSYIIKEVEEGPPQEIETQPYGGLVFPKSDEKFFAIVSEAGLLPIWKDPYRKLGEKKNIWDEKFSPEEVLLRMKEARGWVTKEIRELRNNMEAKIIKLCDLKEQLLLEKKEILVGAVGGFSSSDLDLDLDNFLLDRHLSQIIHYFDSQFFEVDEDGDIDFKSPISPKIKISQYKDMFLEDAPDGSETNTAL